MGLCCLVRLVTLIPQRRCSRGPLQRTGPPTSVATPKYPPKIEYFHLYYASLRITMQCAHRRHGFPLLFLGVRPLCFGTQGLDGRCIILQTVFQNPFHMVRQSLAHRGCKGPGDGLTAADSLSLFTSTSSCSEGACYRCSQPPHRQGGTEGDIL